MRYKNGASGRQHLPPSLHSSFSRYVCVTPKNSFHVCPRRLEGDGMLWLGGTLNGRVGVKTVRKEITSAIVFFVEDKKYIFLMCFRFFTERC